MNTTCRHHEGSETRATDPVPDTLSVHKSNRRVPFIGIGKCFPIVSVTPTGTNRRETLQGSGTSGHITQWTNYTESQVCRAVAHLATSLKERIIQSHRFSESQVFTTAEDISKSWHPLSNRAHLQHSVAHHSQQKRFMNFKGSIGDSIRMQLSQKREQWSPSNGDQPSVSSRQHIRRGIYTSMEQEPEIQKLIQPIVRWIRIFFRTTYTREASWRYHWIQLTLSLDQDLLRTIF